MVICGMVLPCAGTKTGWITYQYSRYDIDLNRREHLNDIKLNPFNLSYSDNSIQPIGNNVIISVVLIMIVVET